MKYSCVIFDLDGTLVDTIGDIAASMNRALEKHGFQAVPAEAYPGMVGWGIRRLALNALPEGAKTEENAALLARDAAAFYEETPIVHSKPYPGVSALVSALLQKKIKIAVISNKPDPVARLVVEGLFPSSFGAIMGERPDIPRKPDPAGCWEILVELGKTPRDCILVGDSEIDMQTARNLGCFPLGVSWGFRPRHVLEDAGAAFIADKPEDILHFLNGER